MFKIPQQEYTPEFKEVAVKRANSGQCISAVAVQNIETAAALASILWEAR